MKFSWCRPRLMLSAAVAVGALASLATAATPAYADVPHISATGGAGGVSVSGGGFNQNASVRLEVLTPGLTRVLDTIKVGADANGNIGYQWLDVDGYQGPVVVAADGAPGPTAWAEPTIPAPWLVANNGSPFCTGIVQVGGGDYHHGDWVRLTMLSGDLGTFLDQQWVMANGSGYFSANLHLTPGYNGSIQIFADGDATTAGAQLSRAC